MTTDQQIALRRIRRKAEIVKMDLKKENNTKHHDMNEILLLLDILERSY